MNYVIAKGSWVGGASPSPFGKNYSAVLVTVRVIVLVSSA